MEAVIAGSENATTRTQFALRERILNGHLSPGDRLTEVRLSKDLGVSRTPLREALSRLETEGLLERVGATGYSVRGFTVEDAADAIELRGTLEGLAVRMAAERGVSSEMLARAEDLLVTLDALTDIDPAAIDFDSYSDQNARFHALLIEMCGSSLIASEIDRVTRLPFASPSAFLHSRTDVLAFRKSLPSAQRQHRGMIESIASRQGARGEALAREHARVALSNLRYAVKQDRTGLSTLPGMSLVTNPKEC